VDISSVEQNTGSEPALYFVHSDHLTTPQVITNQSQSVVWVADYEPFGKAKLGLLNSINLDSRFPGQYLDSETGLYYNYFRDYDPSIGRYIESDPIGLQGGINTYAYVSGNPISNIDPMGLVQMCHRDLLLPIPYARHCYLKYDDGSTSSYDPKGVNPDPDQNQKGTVCTTPKDEDKDDCIKKEMQKCDGAKYNFTQFNCCHCAEQAMKACGVSIPPSSWPNWPINPGPQPGEPNYSPVPKFDPSLGK